MNAERERRIADTFDSAIDLPPQDRARFLDEACGNDTQLRAEIDRLIANLEKAEGFLDTPAVNRIVSSKPTDATLRPGQRIAGRYLIESLIGRGGMGEVYRAHDELLGDHVALKILRPELAANAALAKRFQREIQLARRVTHPNVCRLYEAGVHDPGGAGFSQQPSLSSAPSDQPSIPFFSMQLAEGETLAQRIKRTGALLKEEAYPLIQQLCAGLAAAHQVGVIHRDFKSGNIILHKGAVSAAEGASAAGVSPLITDFGLARLDPAASSPDDPSAFGPATITINQQVAGTVAYMSPEQLTGGEVTPRSDIYSLGVVLYEMATGQLPFSSDIAQSTEQKTKPAPDPRLITPKLPAAWRSAILKCLERDPAKRFPSARVTASHFNPGAWRVPWNYWSPAEKRTARSAFALSIGIFLLVSYVQTRPYQPSAEASKLFEVGRQAMFVATHEAARRALSSAVDRDPKFVLARAYLALALDDLDDPSAAIRTLREATEAARSVRLSRTDVARLQAITLVLRHEYQPAIRRFEDLAEVERGHPQALALMDLAYVATKGQATDQAKAAIERAEKLAPGNPGVALRQGMYLARARKFDAAHALLTRAESGFRAISDYDGLTEVILLRAQALTRAGRSKEAVPILEAGVATATGTKDTYNLHRLKMGLGLVFRESAQPARAFALAQEVVADAKAKGFARTAATGLLDLGNISRLAGDAAEAEQYYRQAEELARPFPKSFALARARLSLASVISSSPNEATNLISDALPVLQAGHYDREVVQANLLLGDSRRAGEAFLLAEEGYKKALALAAKIGDRAQAGLIRGHLVDVLVQLGRLPEAIETQKELQREFQGPRYNLRTAYGLLALARTYSLIGDFANAKLSLDEASQRIKRLDGPQHDLRCKLLVASAFNDYFLGRWGLAHRTAKSAAPACEPQDRIDLAAVAGLTLLRQGKVRSGSEATRSAANIAKMRGYAALNAQILLMLAETHFVDGRHREARSAALEALPVLEKHHLPESLWRAEVILGRLAESKRHLSELRETWPTETLEMYFSRPGLKAILAMPPSATDLR